jgi:16S rRNA (uracil1498-N3)-methyltransferase
VKLAPADYAKKLARWREIALNACKQSGNPFLLQIRSPMTLPEAIRIAPNPSCFGALIPDAVPFPAYLQEIRSPPPCATAVFIGPEGDFSSAEYAQLAASPHRPVSFGSLVLRSETAALFALSALHLTF